jgi:hypothetical protein
MTDSEPIPPPASTAPASHPPALSLWLPWDQLVLAGFDENSAELRTEHQTALAELARALHAALEAFPDTYVAIAGNGDAVSLVPARGPDLGRRRADAALAALVRGGVPPRIMHAASLGRDPPGAMPHDRLASNRRVEIQVIKRNFQAEHRAAWQEAAPVSSAPPTPPGEKPAAAAAPPKRLPLSAPVVPGKPPGTSDEVRLMAKSTHTAGTSPGCELAAPHQQRLALSQAVEDLIADELKRLCLAASLRGPVRALAGMALAQGIAPALEILLSDTHLDDKTKEEIRTILKNVLTLR